ncbi:RRP12-like protein [Pollicipes pollicipes]|uniref:RRP12-like protein n=1 Tax=Pollicipes pollicipes TaxID=41117 RepID=UPI00188511DC|nr:RRP12-like protein [Pollicipes pollicipes]
MTPDCKRHFRQKTRDLLTVFVRKFGFDVIFGLAPSGDVVLQKRLKNIRKLEQRKKADREARKQQTEASDDETAQPVAKSVDDILRAAEVSSDEEEEATTPQPHAGRRAAKGTAWIREDAESIVDLLDPKASRHVTATRPEQGGAADRRHQRRRQEFGLSEDGRLIIDTGDDEDDEPAGSSDDDEEPDQFMEAIRNTAGRRKRKLDASSQGSASEPSSSKYLAGGGGIHRRVGGAASVKSGRSSWSTGGASTASAKSSRSGRSAASRPGAEYASKKGRGDVKRAGRPDPYAYVPLKRSTLNKRSVTGRAGLPGLPGTRTGTERPEEHGRRWAEG